MARPPSNKRGPPRPDAGPEPNPGRPIKRSFAIAGHRTSISLEAAFWDAFRALCRNDGIAMAAQLAEIDRRRGVDTGLSGAVRVWVLQRVQQQAAQQPAAPRDDCAAEQS